MSLGLPQGLNYNAQKARASARQRLITITPDSGTSFTMGQNLSFRLPTSQSYIDTSTVQLKFSITNACGEAGKKLYLCSTANCVIARKTERQAQVISDIGPGYNQLVEILMDTQMGFQQRITSNAITAGNDTTDARLGDEISTGHTKEFQIGLYGGLLGGASKYVPCNLSSSMVLELELETAVRAFIWDTTATPTDAFAVLAGFELSYNTVELPAEMDRMLLASSPVQTIMCEDFQTTTTTMPGGATAHTAALPFNKSSMKSYFAGMFHQDESNSKTTSCINNRARSTLTSFQVNVGGVMFPDKAITMKNAPDYDHGASFFTNALLAVGHITPNEVHHTSMEKHDWKQANGTAANPGSFFVGVDTDSFVGVSSGVYSGKNTLNTNFSPVYEFGAGVDAGGLLFRHFCCFDSVVSVDSSTGLISVSN